MRFPSSAFRFSVSLFLAAVLCCAGVAFAESSTSQTQNASAKSAAPQAAPVKATKPITFPQVFSGWEKKSQTTAQVDPHDEPVLKEFGLRTVTDAAYTRNGEKLKLRVYQFDEATGAYGGFFYFRSAKMNDVSICDRGTSGENIVIFECSNLLIEARLPRATAMSAAEMRDLAGQLPQLEGEANQQPQLTQFMPQDALDDAKYASGPVSWQANGGPIPAEIAAFDTYHPEALITRFTADAGAGNATILKYPTPQIAQAMIRKIGEWHKAQPQKSNDSFEMKRTGPLVAIVSGPIRQEEAKIALERIHYEAAVTWNEQTSVAPKNNVGNLLYNIVLLAFIIGGFGIFIGIVFGGFRVMARRMFPNRVVDRPEDVEIIRLKLDD